MKTYIARLEIKSAVATPFQSDTIFGHIAWAIRYTKSEAELENWLNNFSSSPTLVSDGFPIDEEDNLLFPFPVLKATPNAELEKFIFSYFSQTPTKEDLISAYDAIKIIKKRNYIPQKVLEKYINNLSELNLIQEYFDATYKNLKNPPKFKLSTKRYDMHNTINRLTNTVLEEGGLYSVESTYFQPNSKIWIAIRTNSLNENDLLNIFKFIEKNGFGKDASVGKGAVNLIDITQQDIPASSEPNAYLSLSHFIPDKNFPMDIYYNFIVKFGKLGGSFANSMPVFKKPLIMFKPGSTILIKDKLEFNYELLQNIHPDERIRHYACVFPLPVKILIN